MLNQVKELAQKARDGGNALKKLLNSVTSQFDQVDPHFNLPTSRDTYRRWHTFLTVLHNWMPYSRPFSGC